MPIFRSKRGQQSQASVPESIKEKISQAPDDPIASQEALEAGRLVPAAMRRLNSLSADKSFTSDLSVKEFALLRSSGLQPVCQVSGTSVVKTGYQAMPYGGSQSLSVISDAFNSSRREAIARLEKEAALAHADAVVGTRITQGLFDQDSGLVEFSIIGTAVRSVNGSLLEHRRDRSRAILTTLSGQDLYLLLDNGIVPVGLVGASSCYLATLTPYTFQQMYSTFGANVGNFEIREFTEGFYASRHIVMREVQRKAKSLGAQGIIDFSFNSSTQSYQMPGVDSENVTAVGFITHVLATAVIEPREVDVPKQLKMLFVNT